MKQGCYFLLKHPIRLGDPLMVTKMLHPGLVMKGLEVQTRIGCVLKQIPGKGAVPQTCLT